MGHSSPGYMLPVVLNTGLSGVIPTGSTNIKIRFPAACEGDFFPRLRLNQSTATAMKQFPGSFCSNVERNYLLTVTHGPLHLLLAYLEHLTIIWHRSNEPRYYK